MAIDMQQFHASFFEESLEHLDEMERTLMQMDLTAPEVDDLDCIFRAAHSIKGGSGIFGFEALGVVTHVMENLLDRAREGNFLLAQETVDLLLVTGDLLRTIVVTYRNGAVIPWAEVNQATERLESALFGAERSEERASEAGQDPGFGFFETPALVSNDDDSFGFFDDPSPSANTEAFGFFDDMPGTPADAGPAADVTESPATRTTPSVHSNEEEERKPKSDSAPATGPSRSPGRITAKDSASIRVDTQKVDQLINLVGELVITQSMLMEIGKEVSGATGERLERVLGELERNSRELQESVMSVRMLPISFAFSRFPRLVRDLASKLGKSIDLLIEGGETELDKGLIEKLVDPLTHLVRNSIDHGIEPPATRRQQGKPEQGCVTLRALQQGGRVLIEVVDDGHGLNREKILAKALERGLMVPDDPSDQDVWSLIMQPGFSTAEQVTEVSGRGVGMDVVKRNLEALGGRLEIESEAGQGTRFSIQLPLTLAIVDGMGVLAGGQIFIVPLVNIVESMAPEADAIKELGGHNQLLAVRDDYWPVLSLPRLMQLEDTHGDPDGPSIMVLVDAGRRRFALKVDDLLGQQQVVIKSLERHYRRVPGLAGATIMGDGSVALILDVEALANEVSQGAPREVKQHG